MIRSSARVSGVLVGVGDLLEDHGALHLQMRFVRAMPLRRCRPAARRRPRGFRPDDRRELRVIVRRGPVELGAEALGSSVQVRGGGVVLRPLEHHVLEQMGDADLIGRLVPRACGKRDRDRRGQPPGHRYLDQRHPVGEDRFGRGVPLPGSTREAYARRGSFYPLGSAARISTIARVGAVHGERRSGVCARQMSDYAGDTQQCRARCSAGHARRSSLGATRTTPCPACASWQTGRSSRAVTASCSWRTTTTRCWRSTPASCAQRRGARGLARRARDTHRAAGAASARTWSGRAEQPLRVSGEAAAGHRDGAAQADPPVDRASRSHAIRP